MDDNEMNDDDELGSETNRVEGVKPSNRASNMTQKVEAESMFSDLSDHHRQVRNQRKALAGTMRFVQKSLDGTALHNRQRTRHQNKSLFQSQAYESMYSRNSPWIDDVK